VVETARAETCWAEGGGRSRNELKQYTRASAPDNHGHDCISSHPTPLPLYRYLWASELQGFEMVDVIHVHRTELLRYASRSLLCFLHADLRLTSQHRTRAHHLDLQRVLRTNNSEPGKLQHCFPSVPDSTSAMDDSTRLVNQLRNGFMGYRARQIKC
jgi:hypothetical protein